MSVNYMKVELPFRTNELLMNAESLYVDVTGGNEIDDFDGSNSDFKDERENTGNFESRTITLVFSY